MTTLNIFGGNPDAIQAAFKVAIGDPAGPRLILDKPDKRTGLIHARIDTHAPPTVTRDRLRNGGLEPDMMHHRRSGGTVGEMTIVAM